MQVTAIIGAGVLGLPYAFVYLGCSSCQSAVSFFSCSRRRRPDSQRRLCRWAGGIVTLTLSWLTSLYTLHQLVALHEFNGKRFNRCAPSFHQHCCYQPYSMQAGR